MSNEAMREIMGMDDDTEFAQLLIDQLEWQSTSGPDAAHWDAQAWYGNDYDKIRFKSEGEAGREASEGRVELLWDRVFTRWWSLQTGARADFADGPTRAWFAFGVQGTAPQRIEVEATMYVGDQGRTAARVSAEYECLLTQKLILQPKLEAAFHGKEDAENGVGAGLRSTEAALRLRYELRREFAPYVGIVWSRQFGGSAALARLDARPVADRQIVAGLRVWF